MSFFNSFFEQCFLCNGVFIRLIYSIEEYLLRSKQSNTQSKLLIEYFVFFFPTSQVRRREVSEHSWRWRLAREAGEGDDAEEERMVSRHLFKGNPYNGRCLSGANDFTPRHNMPPGGGL